MAMMKFSPTQNVPASNLSAVHADKELPAATPHPGEVIFEIGVLLAVHLAVAFAVALTLQLCGIA
jgi:hypothetical protein